MTAADGESAGSDFIEVEAPDGSVVEFPKDTAPDVMARAMRRTYGLSETGRRARSVRERGILAEREAQSRRSPMPAFDEMGQPTVPEPPAQVAVIPEPAPFVAQDERTTAGAMGRQVARGAIETAGLVPKGAAALGARLDYNEQDIAGTTDRYAAANPQERAQMRREVLGQFRDSPGTRDSLMSRFSDIDEGVAVPRPQPVTPIEQRQTFKAGEAIDEYGRTRFPTTKAEDEAFWTGQVPRALGSTVAMAPVALAGAPFGALGRLLAGVGLATTGAGEATQNAVDRRRGLEDMVRAGDAPSPDAYPTDRQIATAAGQGLAPGALDAAAIDNLLRPVVRVPGFRGLIAAVAKKAIEQGIVEGTTEGVQQVMQNLIAQHGYNPDQGVLDQVAENVLVGGAVGVLTGGLAGGMIRPRRGDPAQTGGQAPQPVPQQEVPPNVSRETVGQGQAGEINPPAPATDPAAADLRYREIRPTPTPEDLQAVLDDPRPVAEIMAERERQAQRQATIAAVEQEDGPDAAAAVAKVMDGAGQRRTPMQAKTAADVDMAAAQAQQPTPAQAEAGNYRKGHVTVQGLDIAIEVARGGERTGVGPDGRPWSVTMPAHYGYLKAGKDSGDGKVDVFVGDLPDAPYVYVIDQIDPATGKFDEPKVMMGMGSQTEAGAFYEASYSDGSGPARMGAITRLTVAELKAWLRDGNPKKPLAYVPGPPVAAPAADAWASDPIVQAAPAAVPNTPPPFSESRPASTVPLGGQTAAPPSAGFPSPGPMPMAVAPQDPLAQAQAYAESIKTTLSDAEMVDVRDLVAEGVDPEEAVEIALTRSGLDMADEIVAATEEAPDEVPTQAEAEPARAPGAVPAQEGPREEPADARAEAGSAPQGEQPRGAEPGQEEGRGTAVAVRATNSPVAPLTLRIGGRTYPVESVEEASRIFVAARDKFGEGASNTPTPLLMRGNEAVGYISYNGRVWAGSPQDRISDKTPIYDPSGGPVDPQDAVPKLAEASLAALPTPKADATKPMTARERREEKLRQKRDAEIKRREAAKKAIQTRKANAGALNIVQTIAAAGGIKDTSGDLRTIMGRPNYMVPAYGALRNDKGMEPDRAREMMVEAGFLPEGATLNDLYAAIDQTVRGKPVMSARDVNEQLDRTEERKAQKYGDAPDAEPKVMTFDEFSASRGVPSSAPQDAGLHRTPGGMSKPARKAAMDRVAAEMATWQQKRDALRREYADAITRGEIREPSNAERLAAAAAGPDDSPQARAARRALEKRRARAGADSKPEDDDGVRGPGAALYQMPRTEKIAVAKDSLSDEQMVIPGAERVAAEGRKAAKAPQRSVAETPLFGGAQDATRDVKRVDADREAKKQGRLFQAGDRARLRVAGEIDATVNLTPKDAAQRDAVANALKLTLRRMVGKAAPDTAVFDSMMVGDQEITGAYSPLNNLLAVSLRSPDPIGTVRHETIHVLRQLGLIDDAAWSALTQAAETGGWLDKHAIDERWGDGLTRDQALEEAIAEEFGVGLREGVWKTGNARADAIFQRLAEFFRRVRAEIKRALAATGLRDMTDADVAELVFSLIERGAFREGEITARTRQGAMAQTAWHGTPHTFDRFTTEKIGTGEGAQAYGYGLYFAGKKEVAEHYRDALGGGYSVTANGALVEITHPAVVNLVHRYHKDLDSLTAALRGELLQRQGGNISPRLRDQATAIIEAHDRGALLVSKKSGRLYQVELAPAEDEYLLWDKPLSEQSEKVKSALRRAQAANESVFSESMDGDVVDTFAALRSGDDSGGAFYKDIAAEMGAFETSAALHAAGIRGIKYLDGISRNRPLRDVKRAFLDALPEDADTDEVTGMIGKGTFSAEQDEFLRRLQADDWLGFDYPAQAISAALGNNLSDFDPSPELRAAIDALRNDSTYNYVIFDDADVSISAMYQMAAAGAKQAANTPQPRKMRALRAAIGALRGGDAVDPLAKVRVPNDIGWTRKTMVTPRTIAAYFPGFADAFFRGVDQFRTRDMSISELTEIARPYLDLDEAGKEKVNKVVEHGRMAGEVYSPRESDGKIIVKNKVGQQIRGKIGGVTLMADGETVTLDAKEVDAYRAYRKVMDRALDKFRDQVLREWGFDPTAADAPQTADGVDELARDTENAGERARLKTLSTVLSSIELAKRRGYAPFTRYGSHYVTVTTMQDGRSAVVHREHIEPGLTTSPRTKLTRARLEQEAARLRARLADIYPPNRGFEISELREVTPASFDDIPDFSDLDAIIQAANLPPEQAAAVQKAIGEVIQKRGFRAHFIQSRNIPGYSVDFERSLADYIVGISSYLARREHLPEIEDAIASIPATQPEVKRYAKDWNDYIQNPSEEFQGLRQAGFLWYLSGRFSSAVVNLSQIPMVTQPYLSMFAGHTAAAAEIARAYKDAALAIRPKTKAAGGAGLDVFSPDALPEDVRDVVKTALADGTLMPIETFQEMARAKGRTPQSRSLAAKAQAAQDAAAFMFQAAERTNRLVSFIAAYRLAQRPEVMGRIRADLRDNPLWTRRRKDRRLGATEFASFVVEETQFLLGKLNRTRMMRGPGAVIFQFKAFAANYIELMARMGAFGSGVHRGGHRYAALASMMFAMFLVGGLMGLPGAEDGLEMIEGLIKSATGVDPQIERGLSESVGSMAAWAMRQLGASEETQAAASAFAGRVAARGVAREIGVDVSQRIGMGRVTPRPAGTEQDDFMYRAIGLAGIPGSWVLRGIDIGSAISRGDWLQAGIRAAPEAIADPMRAYQLGTEGVKTIAKGRQVINPDDVLPDGSVAGGAANVTKRVFGFQPTGISRAREQMNAVRRAGEAPRDLFADFNLRRANIQAAINRASDTLDRATTAEQKTIAEAAVKRESKRLERVMDEIETYNNSAPDERRYKLANPGYAQQLKVANQGQMATQIKKVPMRVRGSVEDIRSRY